MGFNRRVFLPGLAGLLAMAALAPPLPKLTRRGSGYGPLNTPPKGWRNINRLNRSQHWKPFDTYEQCRAYAIARGFTTRPVV